MLKYILFHLITFWMLLSCNNDDVSNDQLFPQKWQLTEMIGGFSEEVLTGENMDWQEYYLLNADGTFTKNWQHDNNIFNFSGIYEYKKLSGDNYLVFNYGEENEIIGNCTHDPIEILKINSKKSLSGTWFSCDGPALKYELVE